MAFDLIETDRCTYRSDLEPYKRRRERRVRKVTGARRGKKPQY